MTGRKRGGLWSPPRCDYVSRPGPSEKRFEDERRESDHEWTQHGVLVVVDPKSAPHLAGCRIDYLDDLNESGFRIENPNAASTCGCGESFGR